MVVKDVSEKDFDRDVLGSGIPVVIDFWAEWCGPCRLFSPIVEDVSKDFEGKIKFYKLNVDDNPSIAERYSVMSIPTTIFFEKGTAKAVSIGAVPKETFKKWLSKNV